MEIGDAVYIKGKIKLNWLKYVMSISLIYNIVLSGLLMFGCKSFEPYENAEQPQSCNDNITMMRLIIKTNGVFDKSGTIAFLTLLSLSDADCKNDRIEKDKKTKFDDCKKMIYGPVLESKESNYKKYSEFLECLNKK